MINYLPFMQIQKEGRAYILLLPFNAPFEECHAILLEMAQQVLDDQKARKDAEEQAKKEKENLVVEQEQVANGASQS